MSKCEGSRLRYIGGGGEAGLTKEERQLVKSQQGFQRSDAKNYPMVEEKKGESR